MWLCVCVGFVMCGCVYVPRILGKVLYFWKIWRPFGQSIHSWFLILKPNKNNPHVTALLSHCFSTWSPATLGHLSYLHTMGKHNQTAVISNISKPQRAGPKMSGGQLPARRSHFVHRYAATSPLSHWHRCYLQSYAPHDTRSRNSQRDAKAASKYTQYQTTRAVPTCSSSDPRTMVHSRKSKNRKRAIGMVKYNLRAEGSGVQFPEGARHSPPPLRQNVPTG